MSKKVISADQVYMLDEYSSLYAFLGKYSFFRTPSHTFFDKDESNVESVDDLLTRSLLGDAQARANNILYIYGSENDAQRYSSNTTDVIKNSGHTVLHLSASQSITLKDASDVNRWFMDSVAESRIDDGSFDLSCTEWAVKNEKSNNESIIDELTTIMDTISGVSANIITGSALGMQALSGLWTAFRLGREGCKKLASRKSVTDCMHSEAAAKDWRVERDDVKEELKAKLKHGTLFDENDPFQFVRYDLIRNAIDARSSDYISKKLVIYIDDFQNCREVFRKNSSLEEAFYRLMAEETPNVVWVLVSDSKPVMPVTNYLWPDNVWDISPYDEELTQSYLKARLNEDVKDDPERNFARKSYFRWWAREMYYFSGGNRALLRLIADIQKDDDYNFSIWRSDNLDEYKADYKDKISLKCNEELKSEPEYSNMSQLDRVECYLAHAWIKHVFMVEKYKQKLLDLLPASLKEKGARKDNNAFNTMCYLVYMSRKVGYVDNVMIDGFEEDCNVTFRSRKMFTWGSSGDFDSNTRKMWGYIEEVSKNSSLVEQATGTIPCWYLSPMLVNVFPFIDLYYEGIRQFELEARSVDTGKLESRDRGQSMNYHVIGDVDASDTRATIIKGSNEAKLVADIEVPQNEGALKIEEPQTPESAERASYVVNETTSTPVDSPEPSDRFDDTKADNGASYEDLFKQFMMFMNQNKKPNDPRNPGDLSVSYFDGNDASDKSDAPDDGKGDGNSHSFGGPSPASDG